jgi:hypothetical protein
MWVAVPPSMLNRIDVRRGTHHATFAILSKCAWSLCDALTCDEPRFFFESPEQQVGRAHSIPPVE